MPTFDNGLAEVWVKREDESGFGISGCKKRKYASLIPFLKESDFKKVIVIGGSRSNHVVGVVQLLRENRLPFELHLKASHQHELSGNRLLLEILSSEREIRWIEDWERVYEQAVSENDSATYVIPEGGTCPPAFPGSGTLFFDILRNEREQKIHFDHIFIDSGTAMMAGSLDFLINLTEHPSFLHICLTAGNDSYYARQYQQIATWGKSLLSLETDVESSARLYKPLTAASFGAVNRSVIDFVGELARSEGIISDPVYTAKLFMTARNLIHEKKMKGKILVIHSGGGTGLMGFGKRFSK